MNMPIEKLEEMTLNANAVKELVLAKLKSQNIITEEQEHTFANKWQIITTKATWYKRWMAVFKQPAGDFFKYVQFED